MPRVSVIVPIYNALPYLDQCLDSIHAQTLNDIEVLCINDGSTDNSATIAQQHAQNDPRFAVLNKSNGGYGSAVNHGLAHASGDYIAIVEPDDFIHPRMLEDLLSFSLWDTDQPADIIKGSYWEYFDGSDGMGSYRIAPPQFKEMPRAPFILDLASNAQLLFFHPSIWSALYRREFLEEKGLRFLEVPGAGWVDNPFLIDSLLDASKVVWVPRMYYHYRITSAGSSSTLSDYHMVFDRMRNMHDLLQAHNASKQVMEAFYAREFEYIRFVRESGFPDIDPDVNNHIKETFLSMDPNLVKTSTSLFLNDFRYYETVLGLPAPFEIEVSPTSSNAQHNFDATVVCLIQNDADYVHLALNALLTLDENRFEILCVDCGSTDYTYSIIADYAQRTGRITLAENSTPSKAAGIAAGAQTARGTYIFCTDMSYAINAAVLEATTNQLITNDADLALFDTNQRFGIDALCASSGNKVLYGPSDERMFIVPALATTRIVDYAFQINAAGSYGAMFSSRLLKDCLQDSSNEQHLHPYPDPCGTAVLAACAIMRTHNVVYCSTSPFSRKLDLVIGLSMTPLDPRTERIRTFPWTLPAWLHINDRQEGLPVPDQFQNTWCNACAEAFVFDLEHCRSMDAILKYYNTYFSAVNDLIQDKGESELSSTVDEHTSLIFTIARKNGLEGTIAQLYTDAIHRVLEAEQELTDVKESATLRLGMSVRNIANRIIPSQIRGTIRSKIAHQ